MIYKHNGINKKLVRSHEIFILQTSSNIARNRSSASLPRASSSQHFGQSTTGVIFNHKVISNVYKHNGINRKLLWAIHVFASCDVIKFTVKKGI